MSEQPPIRVRIVSAGRGTDTIILDAESGRKIDNCQSVTWSVEAGGVAKAVLVLSPVEVDVVGSVEETEAAGPPTESEMAAAVRAELSRVLPSLVESAAQKGAEAVSAARRQDSKLR